LFEKLVIINVFFVTKGKIVKLTSKSLSDYERLTHCCFRWESGREILVWIRLVTWVTQTWGEDRWNSSLLYLKP